MFPVAPEVFPELVESVFPALVGFEVFPVWFPLEHLRSPQVWVFRSPQVLLFYDRNNISLEEFPYHNILLRHHRPLLLQMDFFSTVEGTLNSVSGKSL